MAGKGAAPGERRGGREKGVRNKVNSDVAAILARMKCSPFKTMAMISDGDVMCGVCRGKGRTKYQPNPEEDRIFERRCQSCYGSGKERINPQTRLHAAAELAQYVAAKRKAIEHTGPEGGAIQHRHEIVFVE